jgi:hypothetical protein
MTTRFEYALNRFEYAAQAENPAEHHYADHRKALIQYVTELENRLEVMINAQRSLSSMTLPTPIVIRASALREGSDKA